MTQQSQSWAYTCSKTWFKRIHTPQYIEALFTIANTWNESKCPSTEEKIKKMLHVYTTDYYSTIKENEVM